MSKEYSEDALVEQATQETLEAIGWQVVTAWHQETFGEGGLLGRDHKSEVILSRYLLKALQQLNPDLPEEAYQQAIDILAQKIADKTLGSINQIKYQLLRNGVPVRFTNDKGELVKKKLKVFNFKDYTANHFLAVRQFEVSSEHYSRRPDVIGFVNGIPLVLLELKAHNKDLRHAYEENLKDYKDSIPHLFHHNAFIILSNGVDARVGTITSPFQYFLEWKRISEETTGIVSLDTMLRGTCMPHHLMDIFENFLLFDTSRGEVAKLMAKNHQYIGVNKVVENIKDIEQLNGKLGVYWHTQGSGKSYSMVFLCEKIHRQLGGSYTFLIVVDRTELENQLYETFSGVGAVLDKNVVAGKKSGLTGREHLRELLTENHRYIFTLIHKFSIDAEKESVYPLITERKNIIVISDEAHRTQNGTFARNMRFNALPNASFLGFTGTPIIKEEAEITKQIFGDYVSVYDFNRAITDGATLPLRYINRGKKLKINNPQIDEKMTELLENPDLDEDQRRKLTQKFQQKYVVLTAKERLADIAKDLVWHFNERGYQGKAMLVALDKPTAVKMYDLMMAYWPKYLQELQARIKKCADQEEIQRLQEKYNLAAETELCIVISSEQNEVDKFRKLQLDIAPHRKKMVDRNLEKEFKDPNNPFRLAIVCAMWITGFDAQCVSTVYLDKPIKGHTLMQTIARANRVYDDEKESGLIVDYGNVYQQLEEAYSIYGEGGRNTGEGHPGGGEGSGKAIEDLIQLAKELKIAIQQLKNYLKSLNFDLAALKNASAMAKISQLKKAADAVSLNEITRATFGVMARNVFRKYKALYPEEQVMPFTKDFNALEAIYKLLNQKTKSADITEVMKQLQEHVDAHVHIEEGKVLEDVVIDLSKLDFDQLKAAFAKNPHKNTFTYDLQQAIKQKLDKMLKENPLRIAFYEQYQKIIAKYNAGKDLENTVKAFEELHRFVQALNVEQNRAIRENLDNQEVLAVYDLLRANKDLTGEEIKEVKKLAKQVLNELKAKKLKIPDWRSSREHTARVKVIIKDQLLYLPSTKYSDDEVYSKTSTVYQHVYDSYFGGGRSVYGGN